MRIAVGEFVVHVDSDDYWITDSVLKKLYETAIIDGCDVLRFVSIPQVVNSVLGLYQKLSV